MGACHLVSFFPTYIPCRYFTINIILLVYVVNYMHEHSVSIRIYDWNIASIQDLPFIKNAWIALCFKRWAFAAFTIFV